jgi:hypothetical protein
MKPFDVATELCNISLPAFFVWAEKEIAADHKRAPDKRRDWRSFEIPYMDFARTVVPQVSFLPCDFLPSHMIYRGCPVRWLVPWSIETEANNQWEKWRARMYRTFRDPLGDDLCPASWLQMLPAILDSDGNTIGVVHLPVARYPQAESIVTPEGIRAVLQKGSAKLEAVSDNGSPPDSTEPNEGNSK